MLVRKLELTGFMAYAQVVVEFPARGVVVVTGPNGSGKSSLYDAVAWATWGCTVRATPPWHRDNRKCVAKLTADGLVIERARRNRKVELVWGGGASEVTYETTTKAQEALAAHVPSYEVWRRSHLFTTGDAWAFGAATDGQRKELLEGLLGLDVFDQGLQQCRADLRLVATRHQDAREATAAARAKVAAYEEQHRSLSVHLDAPCDPALLVEAEAEATRLRKMLEGVRVEIDDLHKRRRGLEGAGAEHIAAARLLRQRLQQLQGQRVCPTCGAEVTADLGAIEREANGCEDAASAQARAVAAEGQAYDAALADLTAEYGTLASRLREAEVRFVTMHQTVERAERAAKQAAAMEERLVQARQDLALAETTEREVQRERNILHATEEVLGLRGVRAQVLDGALQAVEHVANVWLARIAGDGLRVRLRVAQEKKGAVLVDVVSMQVEGAGEGYGYAAASQGERRRLDVALLLAFAEVAGASNPAAPGTLWFDEVFDVLDPAGVEAVCAALQDLATERPVVVITHNDMLALRLRGARHLHVSEGGLTWA